MAMLRKTITITDKMESWVKSQIDSGKYGNDSEYFRDLIRRDQDKIEIEAKLRTMLNEAEASGKSNRSIPDIWKSVEARFNDQNV